MSGGEPREVQLNMKVVLIGANLSPCCGSISMTGAAVIDEQ